MASTVEQSGGQNVLRNRHSATVQTSTIGTKQYARPQPASNGCCRRVLASTSLAWSYTRAASQKDKRGWRIGVATVALVVSFSAVLQAGIATAPVIFLRLAELQAGESDVLLTPDASLPGTQTRQVAAAVGTGFLNYTAIAPAIRAHPDLLGSSPRWLAIGSISAKPDMSAPGAGSSTSTTPSSPSRRTNVFVLALDSEEERRIGIGRAWPHRALGEEEAYVTDTALAELGVQARTGQRVILTLSLLDFIGLGEGGGNTSSAAAADALLAATGIGPTLPTTLPITGLQALQLVGGVNITQAVQDNPALAALGLVTVDAAPLLRGALTAAVQATVLARDVTVVSSLSSPQGKWPSLLGNTVMLEARWAAVLLREAALAAVGQLQPIADAIVATGGDVGPGSLPSTIADLQGMARGIDYSWMQQRAMSVSVMWKRRQEQYLRNMSNVGLAIVEAGDAVMDSVGSSYPVVPSTPLSDALSGLSFIALFLQQVFNAVTFIMALLGAVVIYALVLGDVDARTYELGMLRVLGMDHPTLAQLLAIQTLTFAGPGIVIGFILAVLINIGLQWGMGLYASLTLSYTLPGDAIGLALGLGLGVPCLAVIVPIRQALGSTLRDALDMSHTSINAVQVKLIKLAEAGLSPAQTASALLLTLAGMTTFYLLPLSFITGDLSWFLGVLTGILMGMLLGLAAVAQALQPTLERYVLRLLLALGSLAGRGWRRAMQGLQQGRVAWVKMRQGYTPAAAGEESVQGGANEAPGPGADGAWSEDGRLYTLVSKNLEGHRGRNRKTGYMVGMASAFLVFASTMFALQATNLTVNVKMLLGSDIVATVPEWLGAGVSLPQARIDAYLAQESTRPGSALQEATYISAPLSGFPFIRTSVVSNLVGLPRTRTLLYGVQSSFGRVAYSQYTQVSRGLEPSATAPGVGEQGEGSSGGRRGTERNRQASVWSDPVGSMHARAGRLVLPIESTLTSAPPPVVTGSWALPSYVCARDTAALSTTPQGTGTVQEQALQVVAERRITSSALRSYFWGPTPTSGSVSEAAMDIRSRLGSNAAVPGMDRGTGLPMAYTDPHACTLMCNAQEILGNFTGWNRPPAGSRTAACGRVDAGTGRSPTVPYAGPGTAAWVAGEVGGRAQFDVLLAEGRLYSVAGRHFDAGTDFRNVSDGTCLLAHACVPVPAVYPGTQAQAIVASYSRYVDSITSEALNPAASVDVTTPLQTRLSIINPGGSGSALTVYMSKAHAMIRKLPAFLFSSYATLAVRSPVLITMRDAARLVGEANRSVALMRGQVSSSSGSTGGGLVDPWPPLPTWADVPVGIVVGGAGGDGRQAWVNATYLFPERAWLENGTSPGLALDGSGSTSLVVLQAARAEDMRSSGHGMFKAEAGNGSAGIGFALRSCAFVSGLDLSLPATLAPTLPNDTSTHTQAWVLPWHLYALSDASGRGWARVASGTLSVAQGWREEAPFQSYSSQHWALLVGPWAGGLGASPSSLPIPDITRMRVQSLGAVTTPCSGETLDDSESFPAVPKHRLLVRVKQGASPAARSQLLNGLRSSIGSRLISVQDTQALLDTTELARLGLEIFFNFVAALCLLLCFFATWLSFSANVRETSTEFGVLRSLGLAAATVTRAYMYEALSVVLTALACGIAIGITIAIALTLQFGLFTELPFALDFPYALVLLFTAVCTGLAILASFIPARALSRLPIASVLKGRAD